MVEHFQNTWKLWNLPCTMKHEVLGYCERWSQCFKCSISLYWGCKFDDPINSMDLSLYQIKICSVFGLYVLRFWKCLLTEIRCAKNWDKPTFRFGKTLRLQRFVILNQMFFLLQAFQPEIALQINDFQLVLSWDCVHITNVFWNILISSAILSMWENCSLHCFCRLSMTSFANEGYSALLSSWNFA